MSGKKQALKFAGGIIAVIALVVTLGLGGSIIENVGADQVKIFQDIFDGELHFHTTPGMKPQMFAGITAYSKRGQIDFMPPEDSGIALESAEAMKYGYKLRFNDGGSATLLGSISYELPLGDEKLKMIREMYPSQRSLELDLIKQVMSKSVYMTGPTMSSKESYADKRPVLIEYIEDQAQNGAYMTRIKEVKVDDTISGGKKVINVATIVEDLTAINGRARQEISPLSTFGIKVFNLNIKKIKYSPEVLAQIEQQRKITMQVQTAIAEAKGAEQEAIKAEQEGKAAAMTAKWKQEEVNAKDIAMAEKELKVAELAKKAAKQTKEKDILIGQGQAEKKRLAMTADGALKQKLDAWVRSQEVWAKAYSTRSVPSYYIAGGGAGGMGSPDMETSMFMKLLNANLAGQIGLDMGIKKGRTTK
ncbi:hypothetical protein KAR91_00690 [Candidatus Pacearchaeota archaeon]|nr:hypothetical protein [Candidatus Pacearchaeota archaeon]